MAQLGDANKQGHLCSVTSRPERDVELNKEGDVGDNERLGRVRGWASLHTINNDGRISRRNTAYIHRLSSRLAQDQVQVLQDCS